MWELSKPVGVSFINHFLDLLNDSFVRYFTLSVGSWVICYTHGMVNVEGFLELFPCFAGESSILIRYYILWHTPVLAYMIEKLGDKIIRCWVLGKWNYLDILGKLVYDCENVVIDDFLSVFLSNFWW